MVIDGVVELHNTLYDIDDIDNTIVYTLKVAPTLKGTVPFSSQHSQSIVKSVLTSYFSCIGFTSYHCLGIKEMVMERVWSGSESWKLLVELDSQRLTKAVKG